MGLTKGKIVAIIIIILVILTIAIAVNFSGSGDVKEIFINPLDDYVDGDDSGLLIEANVLTEGSGDVSGKGKIRIFYDNSENPVYDGSVPVDNSKITRKIAWEDFVVGNKQYKLEVEYEKKKMDDTFTLAQFEWAVVENVNVTTQLEPSQYSELDPNADPNLKITTRFEDINGFNLQGSPKDLELELSIQYENNAPINHKTTITGEALRDSDYIYDYDYNTGGGNYTITATVKNLFVQSDSLYETVSSDSNSRMINLQPLALFEINGNTPSSTTITVSNNEEVSFDASISLNDGEIVGYEWDFNYQGFEFTIDETGETVEWTFSGRGQSYDIALRVWGNVFIDDPFDTNPNPVREFYINADYTIQVALIG
jgi:hypothetical protein